MAKAATTIDKPALLVIGYGNTPVATMASARVAEAIGALHLPGVRTMICQQLSPEHAAPISLAENVFVDAAVDAPKEVQFRHLEPNDF